MLRTGDSKRAMSPDYLARLFQQRSQTRLIRFDEQVVPSARFEDLAPVLWQRFKTPRSDEDDQVFLRKLGMLRGRRRYDASDGRRRTDGE